jgi:predicted XRE-type DNA-binding protein
MTAAVQTRCPAWCTEDNFDVVDNQTFAYHAHRIDTDCRETRVEVVKEADLPEAFIDVEVQGGNYWQPADVVKLISALVQAIWILDPHYEHPVDHDPAGLWQAVGKTVRRHLGALGIDQTEAAMLLGINQPDVSMMVRGVGVRTFTLTELDAIASLAGVRLSELVEDIEAAR